MVEDFQVGGEQLEASMVDEQMAEAFQANQPTMEAHKTGEQVESAGQ
jgi:hypothetical protein